MRRATLAAGAALLALTMVAPAVWLAHVMQAAQFERAAADRRAWCAHDWGELAPAHCPMAE